MHKNKAIRLSVFGASGRLGRAIASLALSDPRFSLSEALTHAASPHLGTDIGLLIGKTAIGLSLQKEPQVKSDLWIDASLPSGLSTRLQWALEQKTPLVIGTTGLTEADHSLLKDASFHIPIFYTPNFSIGMALLGKLAQETARRFPSSEIDLVETHHCGKKDRPSGSSLLLAQAVQEVKGHALAVNIQSLRLRDVIGEHSLVFNSPEERLTLSHHTLSRVAFAKGALEAAHFLSRQKAALYTMDDLLH